MMNEPSHPSTRTRLNAPGFTLLELLVVIAILSVLMALIVPGLNSARQTTKRLACQTNLRTLAFAWNEYLDDNEGYFLQGVNMNVNYGGQQGAVSPFQRPKPLNQYVGLPDVVLEGAEVFRCPVDCGSRGIQPSYFEYIGTSYQTNLMLIGQDRLTYPPTDPCVDVRKRVNALLPKQNRARVGNPSKLILMGDYGWVFTWTPWNPTRVEWHGRPDMHNIAFLDGHVEYLRIRKGLHVTKDYNVVPFDGLLSQAIQCQEEVESE